MNYKCPLDKCPVNFWPGRPMIQCLETAHIPLLVDIVHTDITLYASNITQQYIFTNQFNDTSPLKHLSCFYFAHFNTGHCAMFILIFESIFLPGHANKQKPVFEDFCGSLISNRENWKRIMKSQSGLRGE